MKLTYIRRGKNRIPAVNLGNGLLRPAPVSAGKIVAAERNAQTDIVINVVYRSPVTPVSVVHRGGGTPGWGGNGIERDAFAERTKLEKLPATSRRPVKSWKYRQKTGNRVDAHP